MKVINWLNDNLEEILMVILLISIALVMGIQVCARYLFDYSLVWSEEVARYLFVWATFISISYCVKKSLSIKIDQFINILPEDKNSIIRLLSYTIELVFFIYLIPFAYLYLVSSIESGQKSPALGVPMYIIQVAPLISFVLVTIRIVQAIIIEVRYIKDMKRG